MAPSALIFAFLTLLLSGVLSATIPNRLDIDTSHASRDLIGPPDPNDLAFVKVVLDNVNKYRALQDAKPLQYDSELAQNAVRQDVMCHSPLEADDSDGIIFGNPKGNFRDDVSFDEETTNILQDWYNARGSYIADPTFKVLPSGQDYTQLVWKASTHIGCAWNRGSVCGINGGAYPYLACIFSPAGNVAGHLSKNVSCNGCKALLIHNEPSEVTDLQERQSTGSAFGDLLLVRLNSMRAAAHVPLIKWQQPTAVVAANLAEHCGLSPQRGEIISKAIDGPAPPTWDATNESIDGWDNDAASHAVITQKDWTNFGCGWNQQVCPDGKFHLHCFFSTWSPTKATASSAEKRDEVESWSPKEMSTALAKRSPVLLSGINIARTDAGQPQVTWSDDLAWWTTQAIGRCNKLSIDELSIFEVTLNYDWGKVEIALNSSKPNYGLLEAIVGGKWNATKPVNGQWNHFGPIPEYVKIAQPQWKEVGCSWAANCTAKDNYVLYCFFLAADERNTNKASQRRDQADATSDYNAQVGSALYNMRKAAGVKWVNVEYDPSSVRWVRRTADKCEGHNEIPKVPGSFDSVFHWDEAWGPFSEAAMTGKAIDQWASSKDSPDAVARMEFSVMVDPDTRWYECAWSTICGSHHYLVCTFDAQPPTNDVRALDTRQTQIPSSTENIISQALSKLRKEKGISQPEVSISDEMRAESQEAVDRCSSSTDQAVHPQNMLYYSDTWGPQNETWMATYAVPIWSFVHDGNTYGPLPNWQVLVDPRMKAFGCAWSTKCGADHYLFCTFDASKKEAKLSTRAVDATLQNTMGQAFANLRKAPIVYSGAMETQSEADANSCHGQITQQLYPQAIYYYNYLVDKSSTADMTVNAITAFTLKQPAATAGSYDAIVDPTNKVFGCAWSVGCGTDHWLYCTFDYHNQKRGLSTRQADVENEVGQMFANIRKEAGLTHPQIGHSGPLETNSQGDANMCTGEKNNAIYPQTVFKYNDASGLLTPAQMAILATSDWVTSQPDAYKVITDPNNQVFGCAWSTICGPVHWLYCSFFHG